MRLPWRINIDNLATYHNGNFSDVGKFKKGISDTDKCYVPKEILDYTTTKFTLLLDCIISDHHTILIQLKINKKYYVNKLIDLASKLLKNKKGILCTIEKNKLYYKHLGKLLHQCYFNYGIYDILNCLTDETTILHTIEWTNYTLASITGTLKVNAKTKSSGANKIIKELQNNLYKTIQNENIDLEQKKYNFQETNLQIKKQHNLLKKTKLKKKNKKKLILKLKIKIKKNIIYC